MPQPSASSGMPPSDVTQSAKSSASDPRIASPSCSSGCATPVEVSACTTATSRASGCSASASGICSLGTAWPNGARTSITFGAVSPGDLDRCGCRRSRRTPTITVSPGSASDARPASMPEVPLAESAIVSPSLRR